MEKGVWLGRSSFTSFVCVPCLLNLRLFLWTNWTKELYPSKRERQEEDLYACMFCYCRGQYSFEHQREQRASVFFTCLALSCALDMPVSNLWLRCSEFVILHALTLLSISFLIYKGGIMMSVVPDNAQIMMTGLLATMPQHMAGTIVSVAWDWTLEQCNSTNYCSSLKNLVVWYSTSVLL